MEGLDKRAPFTATGGVIPPEFRNIKTPCYILDENALIKNAKLLGEVAERTGCKMLLAQKAFSNYDCYPFFEPYLAGTEGKILVTTGSKELAKFAELPDYKNRVYARVLPLPGVIASCAELGFDAAHTIGMQGPFSMDMNVAMLQSFHAEWMVTKESGRNGGSNLLKAAVS